MVSAEGGRDALSPRGRPDAARARALRELDSALRAYGLDTRVDSAAATVDATTFGIAPRGRCHRVGNRLLLRSRGGGPWWWLMWPPEEYGDPHAVPELIPLAPAAETAEVARRVHRVLVLTVP